MRILRTKSSGCAQAVFHGAPEDTEGILKSGRIYTGTSGGRPRPAARITPGSACLLTGLPEGESEPWRVITGAFMVRKDFSGKESRDGFIPAHGEFRLKLPRGKWMLYHEFDGEHEKTKKWGIRPFQYCTNIKMRNILRRMAEELQNTEQAETAKRFYRYFCKQNHLQCDL